MKVPSLTQKYRYKDFKIAYSVKHGFDSGFFPVTLITHDQAYLRAWFNTDNPDDMSKLNIRASDYRFADKKKYYQGYTTARGQIKPATKVNELLTLSNTKADYTEADIKTRNTSILTGFVKYLKINNLLAE